MEALLIEVGVRLRLSGDVAGAVYELIVDEEGEESRTAEGDSERQEAERIAGVVRFAFLLVVGQHLVRGRRKCGESSGVSVLLQIGQKLAREVVHALAVRDARAHLVVGGDVEIAVFGREKEDDRAVLAGDLVDDVVGNLPQYLTVCIWECADEDAYPMRFLDGSDLGIECLFLGIGEKIRLVDDARVSDGFCILRLRAFARRCPRVCNEHARSGEGALLLRVVGEHLACGRAEQLECVCV